MPDKPTTPVSPDFDFSKVELPSLPAFTPPEIDFKFSSIEDALKEEDFDLAEKELNLFDKKAEEYSKELEQQQSFYQRELEIFKADLEKAQKNSDKEIEVEIGEYRSQVLKFQNDISKYGQELQEVAVKYKWFNEQYVLLMNEYNDNIKMLMQKRQPSKTQAPRKPKERRQEERE